MDTHDKGRLLTPAEAVDHLQQTHNIRRTEKTLAKLRCVGGGPRFRKAGRAILYDAASVDAWAAAVLGREFSSTSEYPTAA